MPFLSRFYRFIIKNICYTDCYSVRQIFMSGLNKDLSDGLPLKT